MEFLGPAHDMIVGRAFPFSVTEAEFFELLDQQINGLSKVREAFISPRCGPRGSRSRHEAEPPHWLIRPATDEWSHGTHVIGADAVPRLADRIGNGERNRTGDAPR